MNNWQLVELIQRMISPMSQEQRFFLVNKKQKRQKKKKSKKRAAPIKPYDRAEQESKQ